VQKKVFVVSLHRSATQSTDLFLRKAGLNTCHYPSVVDGICYELNCLDCETERPKIFDLLRPVFDVFDGLGDLPIPAIYEELDAAYPEAKFIAVYRSPRDWVCSVRQHTQARNLMIYERVLYWRYLSDKPLTLNHVPDDALAELHRRHHQGLAAHFAGRNNFLMVDLAESDLGNRLSSFLRVPQCDFPRFDYHMIPNAKHDPDHFRVLGQRFVEELVERNLVIAELQGERERLRQEFNAAYRFSLTRLQNQLRRIIRSRAST
jgi:hypothetical protein